MKLTVNGEDRAFPSNLTVASLLAELGLKSDRVAVELNRHLLPRDRWDTTRLAEGDKLEIVQFVGGGACSKLAASSYPVTSLHDFRDGFPPLRPKMSETFCLWDV